MSAVAATSGRHRLVLLGKALLSVGIVAWLLSSVDVAGVFARAADADQVLIVLAAILTFTQFLIAALRWMAVSDALGGRLGFGWAFRLVYIGQFFNLVLPSTVGGDAVRAWMIWKSGLTPLAATSSVLLDRYVAVLGLILTIVAMHPFLPPVTDGALLSLAVWGLLAAAVAGTVLLMLLDYVPGPLARLRPVVMLAKLAVLFRAVLLSPRHALVTVGLGVVGQVNLSLSLYVLAQALGVELTVVDCLVMWPLVVLATLLPVSISGWGVREGAMVIALGLVGVPSDAALLLSLLIGLLATLVALPGGLVWLATNVRTARVQADRAGG